MKKISKILLLVATFFLVAGCGNKKVDLKNASLEDIMAKVYEKVPEEKTPMMLENIPVTKENVVDYLGCEIEFEEALASESMTGSIAHSVVLVRTKPNADIEKIKKDIKENVNPRKWICVGIERDEVEVLSKDNIIIMIIAEEEREDLVKGFKEL